MWHLISLVFCFFKKMSYCKFLVYTVPVTLVAVFDNIGALPHLISYPLREHTECPDLCEVTQQMLITFEKGSWFLLYFIIKTSVC